MWAVRHRVKGKKCMIQQQSKLAKQRPHLNGSVFNFIVCENGNRL